MNHPNLQELATRIHAQNKAASWWDIPRPRVQTAWLVVTELAEATEAERAEKYADLQLFQTAIDGGSPFALEFRAHIKDTFEDEIADAVIRLLDFAASEDIVIGIDGIINLPENTTNEEVFFQVASMVREFANRPNRTCLMSDTIGDLIALAGLRGFDLWQHVELKLKYNQTRGKMHGGKKF